MRVERLYTREGESPYARIHFVPRTSRIVKLDGTVVFEAADVMVPDTWDQVAVDILAQKYFRRKGCNFMHPGSVYNHAFAEGIRLDMDFDHPRPPHSLRDTGEWDLRQIIHRIVGCWTHWGLTYNYFDSTQDAQAFYDELSYMLAKQMFAPNSPQWFNTGLHFAYGIEGDSQGHWLVDPLAREVDVDLQDAPMLRQMSNAYEHPQTSACQPYHALVSTPTGPMPIGDIVTQKLNGLQVFDRSGVTRVVAGKCNGIKPVLRVITKSGHSVEATADHQILARTSKGTSNTPFWTTVGALKVGQMLVYRANTVIEDQEVSDVEVAEAFLAGWLQGDGHVGVVNLPRGTSMVIEAMTADADEHKAVMDALALVFPSADPNIIEVATLSSEIDLKRIRFYGKDQCTPFVDKYNLLDRRQAMRVPTAVVAGGRQTVTAYLRGLFQADGYVSSRVSDDLNTHIVALDTISKDLMEEVHALLANFGIFSRIKGKKEPREDRQDRYCIGIQVKSEREKFATQIGFVSNRKQLKLLSTLAPEIPGRGVGDEKALQIERIEYLGDQEVYDIQTESENYLCGNIVVHNCFIQSVKDDLVNEGGIMDLYMREARLFKFGSGSGTNFSNIRGKDEPLSGGGVSSGLMSFLRVGDTAAGSIKSGGTSRRAAKMLLLDIDHPDIEAFIQWKVTEEHKVAMLVAGSKAAAAAWEEIRGFYGQPDNDETKLKIKKAVKKALKANVPMPFLTQCLQRLQQGDVATPISALSLDWDGDAYGTVSSQNANNSVRLTDEFMNAVVNDLTWDLKRRVDGKIVKTLPARQLWDQISHAAWMCADPGVQFASTYNNWHTGLGTAPIRGTNPCSEYAYIDDTACNLASTNLMAFICGTNVFDIPAFAHANRLITIALEITVAMSSFPSATLARNSFEHRTLGLGYANLGTLLMHLGLPYDSYEGRAIAGVITSMMTATAYRTSADMAKDMGPYAAYEENESHMLRVLRNHHRAASGETSGYEGLNPFVTVQALPRVLGSKSPALNEIYRKMFNASGDTWTDVVTMAPSTGLRNAQVTVLAPTGTIGLLMGCDTTGVEPDFALVKFKKLAGGGYFKMVNESVSDALKGLGYTPEQVKAITDYATGEDLRTVAGQELLKSGYTAQQVEEWVDTLKGAFNPAMVLPMDEWYTRFNATWVDSVLDRIAGTGTVEGAPGLKAEHLPIFDCANRCGKRGTRFISPEGHLSMMAAVQPFLSGSISKTVNLPAEATIETFSRMFMQAWRTNVKSVALYRDGSKFSQPLATSLGLLDGLDDLEDDAPVVEKVEVLAKALSNEVVKVIPPRVSPEPASRVKLPGRRGGYTQAGSINGTKIYLHTGEYPDGTLGEIFLDMHKEGAAFRSIMNAFAIAISIGLQYGVPLEEFCDAFLFTKFEPQGMVQGHPLVKMTTSVIDFIFRDLAISYLGRNDLAHVKPEDLLSESGPRRPIAKPVSRGQSFGMMADEEVEESPDLMPTPTPAPEKAKTVDLVAQAKQLGFTGDPCPRCQHLTMVRNGTCLKCETCGETTGCS